VQFHADAELDNVVVTHPKHTTFKKALNQNMQDNRKGAKEIVEKMFASENYPQELWPLISKQQVWYDCITAYRTQWLKTAGKGLVSLQLQPNGFHYAFAASSKEREAKSSTNPGRIKSGKQASVPHEHQQNHAGSGKRQAKAEPWEAGSPRTRTAGVCLLAFGAVTVFCIGL
jgi:hypothetical protein